MQQGHQVASPHARDRRYGGRQAEGSQSMLSAGVDRQHRITLPSVPESARTAREFTAAALRAWQLGPLIDDAIVIASELVTNAIRHGTPGSAGGHVQLSWSYQVSRLLCVITAEASEP